jgi:hypothetical protein
MTDYMPKKKFNNKKGGISRAPGPSFSLTLIFILSVTIPDTLLAFGMWRLTPSVGIIIITLLLTFSSIVAQGIFQILFETVSYFSQPEIEVWLNEFGIIR